MIETENKLQIAVTIHEQLGHKCCVMIGATNFMGGNNSLTFKIGRNCKKVTHVKIELNALDLYNMEFYNIRGAKVKTITEIENIYADQMHETIREYTGMSTSL